MIQPETIAEIQHVGAIITTIATANEKPVIKDITPFDSSVVPQLCIARYMHHLGKYTDGAMCGPVLSAVAMSVYARRVQKKRPDFRITLRNMHRLYLAATVVVQKLLSDEGLLNTHYARAGGVSLKELNRLEVTLLSWLDWDASITPREYFEEHSRLKAVKVPISIITQNTFAREAVQQHRTRTGTRLPDNKRTQLME